MEQYQTNHSDVSSGKSNAKLIQSIYRTANAVWYMSGMSNSVFTILDRQSIVTNVENEWERLSKTRKFTNNCSIRPEIDIAILRTCASSVFL